METNQASVSAGSAPVALRTILILTADPQNAPRLRLDDEVKKIQQGMQRAKKRDHFRIEIGLAVTDDDLRRALLDYQPQIVHFSGHGNGPNGLCFQDDQGNIQEIPGDALARLFKLCKDYVQCVVLNACYSEVQAVAISQHIPYVVGMNKAIGDPAAIKFATGFYDAIGAGHDYETAFEFGRSAIDLKGIPEYQTPILKVCPPDPS